MIRIAYLIDSLQIGGTEKQLAEMVNRLDRTRFQPVVVCIRPSDEDFVRSVACEVKEIPFRSFKSLRAMAALVGLVRFLRGRQIDIVQTFFIDAAIFGVIGAKLAGVGRIISSRRDLGFWQNRSTLGALGFVNRWVDRFWVNSRTVGLHVQQVERVPESKIDLIYNGIDIDAFRRPEAGPSSTSAGPVVGIVANLNRQVKRVDLFIRAAALVARQCPSATFRIVGEGKLRSGLEYLGRDLELGDRLSFLGSRSDVASVAGEFDVAVLCSDSEGFSNSILEYFALGVPVVATAVGGNTEIIEDGGDGYLVEAGDHEALADRIVTLLKDQPLRKEMGRKGRAKVVQRFAWPARIAEIELYYQSV